MSKRVVLAAIAAAATIASVNTARAAEVLIEQEYTVEEPVVEYYPSAYYARVDCAYAFNEKPDLMVGSVREHFVQKNGGRITIDDSWACGVGLGHRINANFRVDATVEWRSTFDLEGVRDPAVTDSLGQKTKISSTVGLLNAYYDIGNFGGVTPYVGAGIGVARNKMGDSLVPSSGFKTLGDTRTSLAWALMAGASYELTDSWSIDAGYRYINFGDATTTTVGSDGSVVPEIESKDMAAHEIRVGLRYAMW
ncbi:Outer surface protein [hydrothermal vent metagenome]|uniref:Outer surface protein n=1 Tax=hydrothermal vent metagenome TaxID=652676 RepID=A0A3B0T2R5_9ZZZZ